MALDQLRRMAELALEGVDDLSTLQVNRTETGVRVTQVRFLLLYFRS